jgi:hypothetical protein
VDDGHVRYLLCLDLGNLPRVDLELQALQLIRDTRYGLFCEFMNPLWTGSHHVDEQHLLVEVWRPLSTRVWQPYPDTLGRPSRPDDRSSPVEWCSGGVLLGVV